MKRVYIVAGGTGGHINAALSMGEKLNEQYDICYLTGRRYLDYQLFKSKKAIHLNSQALRSKSPIKLLKSLVLNFLVFIKILFIYLRKRPEFIIGAGGYVCGPTLLCGKFLGVKVFIIEQNAVVGLTNRLLANISTRVFTSYDKVKGLEKIEKDKIKNFGNPIRNKIKYTENILEEKLKLLIFGGSLGATQINAAVREMLDKKMVEKIDILHQVGKDNLESFLESNSEVSYEQVEFITDMDRAYAWANIIIARAGASTVSELRVVQRPTIFIPFPGATDNHQFFNAKKIKEENLFPCHILDQTLKGEKLALSLKESIMSMRSVLTTEKNSPIVQNSSQKIQDEIELCLK